MAADHRDEQASRRTVVAAGIGLLAAVALVTLAFVLPPLTGWDVAARRDDLSLPPLHGYLDLKTGPGTVPAVVLAVLACALAGRLERLRWRWLLLVVLVLSLAWLLSLALVDGVDGLTRALGNKYEYLPTAREITDVPATIDGFIGKIPYAADHNWVTHIAGHPVGALLVFVALVRLGLGSDLDAALVVTIAAATIAPAVLVTLRALGAEPAARRAAPFLAMTPAAVFLAVSADALFAAVAAWGLAALALAATSAGARSVVSALVAGLLLGCCVELSYGLPLLGVLALGVLVAARRWWPVLPVAVVGALVPVLVLAALGFAWWEAYPVLVERYHDGIADDRPGTYWWWGNLGALLVSAGPALGAGLGAWIARIRRPGERAVMVLVGAAVLSIALADASGMSKAEVERIWLPFIPWLTLSFALLPGSWRRSALVLQVGTALVVQHLLYTSW